MPEYNRIWSLLGDRRIEDLADLPRLADPDVIDMLDVFTEIVHPAMFYDENLSTLVVCRMVNLSLEHGNSDGSAFGYVLAGDVCGSALQQLPAGISFRTAWATSWSRRGASPVIKRERIFPFATLTPWAGMPRRAGSLCGGRSMWLIGWGPHIHHLQLARTDHQLSGGGR